MSRATAIKLVKTMATLKRFTNYDLAATHNLCPSGVSDWLHAFEKEGVLKIVGRGESPAHRAGNQQPILWEWQL